MYRRARITVLAAAVAIVPALTLAQAVWQPTPPPLVTAENETWYRAGGPIEWNGDFYYPAGAPRAFDAYAMVRAGSYRGIPLYSDATLEPYSIVFVPVTGGRMQPYERKRAGMLADTTGSQTPSFPPQTSASLSLASGGFVAQAAMPPTFARPYDLAPAGPPEAAVPSAAPSVTAATGTAGRIETNPSLAVGTSGRSLVTAIAPRTRGARSASGVAIVWIDYQGQRWTSDGKAVDLDPDLHRVGTYRGFPIYARADDRRTIYVPSSGTLVVPYTAKH
jgi:hypothetical protein